MSHYNGNGNGSASISFPPFSELIEEYCDPTPKEKGKFFCPACHGHNLSLGKNGAFTCYDDPSKEHNQEIIAVLNEKFRSEHPELSSGKNGGHKVKVKSERQVYAAKAKAASVAAVVAASEIELKVEELTCQLDPMTKRGTEAALQVDMAAWAKAHGYDVFSATRLLAESLKRASFSVANSALRDSNDGDDRDGLTESIRAVLDQNLTNGQLAIAKSQVRKDFGIQPTEFSEIWKAISEEFEVTPEDADDRGEQISKLLDSQKATLKAAEVISPEIAAAISELAQWHNMREEVYMSMYMAAIGSCARNGAVLNANIFTRFRVTPNLYALLVAESSQKKSPVLTTMVGDPLKVIQKELKAQWKEDLASWHLQRAEAAKNDEPFEKPEPAMPVLSVTKYTGESILSQANRCPDYGILINSDEAAGAFNSRNQYRGGRGSDSEDMLTYYDGHGGSVLRVDGLRDDVDYLNLGWIGAIQPRILEQFMRDAEDSNGNWARFSFIHQPNTIGTLPTRAEGKKIDYCELLADVYRRVMAFEAKEYYFTEDADDKFVKIYNRCEVRRVNHHSGAMRAAWGKIAGRIAKYALNLHLESAAVNRLDEPSSTIPIAILDKATKRAMLDIQQLEANYCSQENEIAAHFAKLISLSQQKGSISARDVSQSFSRDKRPDAPTVRQWFAELTAMGWGETDGSGIRIHFKAFSQQKQIDLQPTKNLQFQPTVETVGDKEVQPFVGFVDKSLNIDEENRGEKKNGKASTKPTNLQNDDKPLVSTVSTVDKTVDTKSTNLQTEDLEIGQTIEIMGGLHKDSVCTVLEIEEPSTNGETTLILLKNGYPLAMALSSLLHAGYRICES